MRLVRLIAAALAATLVAFAASSTQAKLLIEVDKSAQRMIVSADGAQLYVWPVSTGVSRYDTPGGHFTPFRMERDHFSREWDNAPMPNSIFFTKQGHAIHGTSHRSLGRPASHGCVRLSVENSRVLFDLVRREGMANTRVVLLGHIPYGVAPEVARRAPNGWDGNQPPSRYQHLYDDNDVTGTVPQAGQLPSRSRYRQPYSESPQGYGGEVSGPQVYDDRDVYRRPSPPPFFFPSRGPWD